MLKRTAYKEAITENLSLNFFLTLLFFTFIPMKNSPPPLSITLIQSDLHWHNIDANLAMFEEKIWQIEKPTDLIILPEMFNTGFTQAAEELAEPMNSKTFRWMRQQAMQTKAVVTGSYIVRDNGHFYNRLLWMEPDGNFDFYDKRHLFRMSNEHHTFSEGHNLLIKKLKGWLVCPMVCYDLRFPVWSRNRVMHENILKYDVLIYVANWPAARSAAWYTLLQARAIENLSYVIGANRVGTDGNDIAYDGKSAVIDPKGNTLFYKEGETAIHTVSLDYESLATYRQKFPAHLDADSFTMLS